MKFQIKDRVVLNTGDRQVHPMTIQEYDGQYAICIYYNPTTHDIQILRILEDFLKLHKPQSRTAFVV